MLQFTKEEWFEILACLETRHDELQGRLNGPHTLTDEYYKKRLMLQESVIDKIKQKKSEEEC
jgi:hypothetical protein